MSPLDAAIPETRDFEAVASQIVLTRSEFGRAYDEARKNIPASRPFNTVSAGADDHVAFVRALRLAKEQDWLPLLLDRLVAAGASLGDGQHVTTAQALLNRAWGFPDAAVVEKGGLRARARLCKVEVSQGPNRAPTTGSGFLVGPSTVLTAFHVIAGLVGGQTPLAGSASRLVVRFDHASDAAGTVDFNVMQSWLVASSRPHPAEIKIEGETAKPVQPQGGVDLTGCLDYAVIALAGSPGAERGFYDLRNAVAPAVGGEIHLYQHPMGLPQRETNGEFRGYRFPPVEERIDHRANAEPGSSGGLLLDGDYALVGLHQGAYGNPVVNTGISAIAIREDVTRQGANLFDSSYVRAFRVADNSRPILGRASCQEWIRRGTQPLVRVMPLSEGKGVSFTEQIMQACLPDSDNRILTVRALELDSDAMTTATMLLDKLGADVKDLPTEAGVNSTRGAWLKPLVAVFTARVAKAHPDRVVWLVIDDLQGDEDPIPSGSVRDFLSELYNQSKTFRNFRIVLLGMSNFPSGFPTGLVTHESISPPQRADIVSYVRLRLTEGGVDHTAAEAERLAALIELSGGSEIARLSDYVADKVDQMLNDAIGNRA